MFNLLFGVARDDVLWAIPIERLKPKPEDPFRPSLVGRVGHQFREFLVSIKRQSLHIRVNFEPCPSHIIHQEQAGPIISGKIAGADVLAITPVVGKGQCSLIDDLKEAGFSSTVLHVWPTCFGDRCHIEAVT